MRHPLITLVDDRRAAVDHGPVSCRRGAALGRKNAALVAGVGVGNHVGALAARRSHHTLDRAAAARLAPAGAARKRGAAAGGRAATVTSVLKHRVAVGAGVAGVAGRETAANGAPAAGGRQSDDHHGDLVSAAHGNVRSNYIRWRATSGDIRRHHTQLVTGLLVPGRDALRQGLAARAYRSCTRPEGKLFASRRRSGSSGSSGANSGRPEPRTSGTTLMVSSSTGRFSRRKLRMSAPPFDPAIHPRNESVETHGDEDRETNFHRAPVRESTTHSTGLVDARRNTGDHRTLSCVWCPRIPPVVTAR